MLGIGGIHLVNYLRSVQCCFKINPDLVIPHIKRGPNEYVIVDAAFNADKRSSL